MGVGAFSQCNIQRRLQKSGAVHATAQHFRRKGLVKIKLFSFICQKSAKAKLFICFKNVELAPLQTEIQLPKSG